MSKRGLSTGFAGLVGLLLITAACQGARAPAGLEALSQPQTADFEQILAANNRRTELFRYAPAPSVYVLDFIDLDAQAEMLNRIAAFIELADAPRDRILTPAEIKTLLGKAGRSWRTLYYGHDYRAADLARFFSLAQTQPSPLNAPESRLLDLLLEHGFITREGQTFSAAAPAKALISIPEDASASPSHTRREILKHELRHGLYFTDESFRERCRALWLSLTAEQTRAFGEFLRQHGYDIAQEYLLINEFQAYLSATDPDQLAANLGLSRNEIDTLRKKLP